MSYLLSRMSDICRRYNNRFALIMKIKSYTEIVETAEHHLKFLRPTMPPFPPEVNVWHLPMLLFILSFCIVYTLPVLE